MKPESEYQKTVRALFDQLEARLKAKLAAASDARGLAPEAVVDRILEEEAAFVGRFLDRLVDAADATSQAAGKVMREELVPVREMLKQRASDLLRPH